MRLGLDQMGLAGLDGLFDVPEEQDGGGAGGVWSVATGPSPQHGRPGSSHAALEGSLQSLTKAVAANRADMALLRSEMKTTLAEVKGMLLQQQQQQQQQQQRRGGAAAIPPGHRR